MFKRLIVLAALLPGACERGDDDAPAPAPDSYPRYGGLYWGHIEDPRVDALVSAQNGLVIFSEANYLVKPAARRPGAELFISTNSKSVWATPSAYFPAQAEALAAANAMDALMKRTDGSVVAGWPGSLNIDLTQPAFRSAFAEIIVRRIASRDDVAGVFMDECHEDIYENEAGDVALYGEGAARRAMTKAEAKEAWTRAMTVLLDDIARRSGRRVMLNGTMPLTAGARGRFYQGYNAMYPEVIVGEFLADAAATPPGRRDFILHGAFAGLPQFLNDATQLSDAELLAWKVFTGPVAWLPAASEADYRRFVDYTAAFASLVDAAAQVDDNRFVSPWNGAAVSSFAAGSFGAPLEYVEGTSTVPVLEQVPPGGPAYVRRFEHADVIVNSDASTPVTWRDTVIAPRSARVFPR